MAPTIPACDDELVHCVASGLLGLVGTFLIPSFESHPTRSVVRKMRSQRRPHGLVRVSVNRKISVEKRGCESERLCRDRAVLDAKFVMCMCMF